MSKYNRPKQLTPVNPELAPPDRFLSFWQRVGELIVPLLTRLLGLALVAAVVGAVFFGVLQLNGSRKEKATEKLAVALRIYQAELKSDAKADPAKPEDSDDTPRFKTAKERAEATLAALDKLDQEYKGSDAANRGQLVRAGVLYDLARYDQAATVFRQILDQKPGSPDLLAASREGLGLTLEVQGKNDEALTVFKNLAGLPGDYYKDRMLWAQARILAKKGDKTSAAALYKEIAAKTQSALKDEAQNRLAALEN